jgi:RNA polymerase sigma factor (sigma-70 family)
LSQEIMTKSDNSVSSLPSLVERILQRNGEKWFKFVLRVVGNYEDAEDALQEGVRRVLGCDRAFRLEEEARMYLARSISNAAFETYKCRKRQRQRQIAVTGNLLLAGRAADPQSFIEQREAEEERERQLSVLQEVLGRLPGREYHALRITVLDSDGGSIRDAGLASGIPYSTLRHRRNEGLRRLRKYLARVRRRPTVKAILTQTGTGSR